MPAATTPTKSAPIKSFSDFDMPESSEGDAPNSGTDTPPPEPKKEEPTQRKEEPKKVAEPPEKKETADTKKSDDVQTNPHLEEPTAKPAVKKEPVTTGDPDEIPPEYLQGMTQKAAEKAKQTWKSNKAERAAALADLAQAETEMVALKKQIEEAAKGSTELEQLKQEKEALAARLAEYEGEIAVTRVEATPKYKEQVSGPIKASEETTRALATKYEISPASLLDALHEPDADKRADALSELASEFKGYDQTKLYAAADAYAAAVKAGEALRTKANESLAEMEKQAKADSERVATANIADYRKAAGSEWKAMQERHPELRQVEIQPTDTAETKAKKEAWNNHVDSIRQEIESLNVNELPVGEVARMKAAEHALKEMAAVSNYYRTATKELREKVAELEQRLADYVETDPGAGAGRTPKEEAKGPAKFADIPLGDD